MDAHDVKELAAPFQATERQSTPTNERNGTWTTK